MDSGAITKRVAPWVVALVLLPACAEQPARSLSGAGSRPAARPGAPVRENDRVGERPKERSSDRKRDASTASSRATVGGPFAHVFRVVDGDTIEVHLDGREEDVRLIGIDTPETVHPSKPVECFGTAASEFTTNRLAGHTVRLEFDVERRDRYGRLLAYVWRDGKLFNQTIVGRGYAQVATYPPNVKYVDRLTAAQRRARSQGAGLWSRCDGQPTGSTGPAAGDKTSSGKCDANYSGACIRPYPPDLDCGDVAATNFRSTGSDPHGFDGDGDGMACES